jgi:hypothetical protein
MVDEIAYFEIEADASCRARYGTYYDEPAAGDYGEKISQAARAGRLPGSKPLNGPRSTRPERFLDIREDAGSDGIRAYAFRLHAVVHERHRLEFGSGAPIIKLPVNSSTNEEFITEIRRSPDQPRHWASFVCDLGAVRRSHLADRIRCRARKAKEPGPLYLSIPFCLNLVDPVLEAAPWVVPEHENPETDGVSLPIYTHGGVHPAVAPALVVEL